MAAGNNGEDTSKIKTFKAWIQKYNICIKELKLANTLVFKLSVVSKYMDLLHYVHIKR